MVRDKKMKRRAKALILVGLFLFVSVSFFGWSSEKNLDKKIEDILSVFPAEDSSSLDSLSSKLTALGKEGLIRLCLFLEDSEENKRTKAEYAVHGLAVSSASLTREGERFLVSKSFIKALEVLKDKEAKAFAIGQLQLVGKREAVRPLASYLTDPQLYEPAARALTALGTEKAEKAFIKAMDSESGDRRLTFIKALGELRSRKAVKKIKPYASSEQEDFRRVSLYALANIGDPSCMDLLGRVRIRSSVFERSEAPLVYLLYIRRLAESGHKGLGANICRDMIAHYSAEDENHVQCAALDLLVDISGKKALDDLLGMMESQSSEVRQKVLDLALDIYDTEMKQKWIGRMQGVPSGVQAEILTMLGKTEDKSLLSVFKKTIHSESLHLRKASVMPLSKLGREKSVDDLFQLLHNNIEEETRCVQQALLSFKAESIIPRIQREFDQMPPNARLSLMEVIFHKQALDCSDLIISQIKNGDQTLRKAALSGLHRVVDKDDISVLIDMLKETDEKREITLLQRALEAACQSVKDPEKRAEKVLEALAKAEGKKKIIFLRPLSAIGGKKALKAVVEAQNSSDQEVALESFYTLVEWKKLEASEELLSLCRQAEDKKHRYLALRSYIRLITSSELKKENKLKMLLKVKTILQEKDEQKLFLLGLGEIKTLDSLKEAAVFLGSEELRETAARILVKIALPDPLHDGLQGREVSSLLEEAQKFIEDEYEKKRVYEYIEKIRN